MTPMLIWFGAMGTMEAGLFNPNLLLAFLGGFALALVWIALLGRAPGVLVLLFRALARLGRPFRFITRRLRPRSAGAARGKLGQAAAEGSTVVARRPEQTDIEAALAAAEARETDESRRRGRKLDRTGYFFRSIRVPGEYLPAHLAGPLTDDIGAFYFEEAGKFFAAKVDITANPASLYEDAEGAHIIDLFRNVDRRCYYLLNEMRKTLNDNVRRLILLLTLGLSLWTFYALAEFAAITHILARDPSANGLNGSANHLIGPFLGFVLALIMFFVIQGNGYRQQQRHGMRELRSFLTLYLGRIADRYRETTGNAKQVTVGAETNSAKLSEAAKKWHKTLIWLPFRTFFIECFVRNVLYQINRNSGYYLWIPPLAVAALLLLIANAAGAALWLAGGPMQATPLLMSAAILALMLAILLYFYFDRIHAVVLRDEIGELDWLGFESLDLSSVMDEVVGKYAEDIGFWKQRMPRN